MQVPAPFDYVRATSVDNALELLERHGPESRVIAGGHSLLPMMKLRLARPEWLIDINDLAELRHITVDGDWLRVGALTRHADLLASDVVGAAVPDRPRRGEGHRRPGRAQPRHDRRLARPGRPGRGPHHGLRRPRAPRWSSPARAGERTVDMAEFHRGPYETAVRAARAAHRDPVPDPRRARAAPTRRSSAGSATGRSAPPAPPSAMAEDGTIADADDRPHRPRARGAGRPTPPPCCVGQRPSEDLFAEAGRLAARGQRTRSRTSAARSTTSGTSPTSSPGGSCAGPRPRRATHRRPGRLTMQVTHDRQRRPRSPATSNRGCCSCTSCARRSA